MALVGYADDREKLQEERLELAQRMKDIGKKEVNDWSAEDQANWDELEKRYDEVVEQQEGIENALHRAAKLDKLNEKIDREKVATRSNIDQDRQMRSGPPTEEQRCLALQGLLRHHHRMEMKPSHSAAIERLKVNPEIENWARMMPISYPHGAQRWSTLQGQVMDMPEFHKQSRALQLAATEGLELVPEGFVNELEVTLQAFGGFRRVARIMSTSTGNDMPWPTMDDTGNTGRLLAEEAAITTTNDPTTGAVIFNAFKYSSDAVLVSAELLEDSAFNLATELARALGIRIGRITSTHFATGTGSGQPQGITVGASAGVTAASATAVTADELIDLQDSIDPAYETFPSIGWAMRKATLTAIRKLKDGDNQYLWQPGLQSGRPDQILGSPFTVVQEMPAMTTGNVSIVYGAFEFFIIRDAGLNRIIRLDELYRANDQTGFIVFSRHDSNVIQSAAIKKLTQA